MVYSIILGTIIYNKNSIYRVSFSSGNFNPWGNNDMYTKGFTDFRMIRLYEILNFL